MKLSISIEEYSGKINHYCIFFKTAISWRYFGLNFSSEGLFPQSISLGLTGEDQKEEEADVFLSILDGLVYVLQLYYKFDILLSVLPRYKAFSIKGDYLVSQLL